jgi:hypothetical protein
MLSRENAFQLDSWDKTSTMKSAGFLQATSKNYMGAVDGSRLGGGFGASIPDVLED